MVKWIENQGHDDIKIKPSRQKDSLPDHEIQSTSSIYIKEDLLVDFVLIVCIKRYCLIYQQQFPSMKAFTFVILALITLSYAQDNNCQTKTASGCSNCWSGFFIGPLGVCKSIPVGANCNTYNMTTGDCLNCWSNDVVVSGVCVAASSASTTIQNPNCATSNTSTGACISCWQGFYFSNGQCLQGNPLCKTFDNSGTGACGSCWGSSYYLAANGQCIQGNGLCATYTNTGLCATCWASSYYYINAVGLCALVSGTCKTWDPNTGNCLSCWWGTAHNLTCY